MRYFLDTIFLEAIDRLHLLSLALVAESGREFYGETINPPLHLATDFQKQHVLPLLKQDQYALSWPDLRREVLSFILPDSHPVFYADRGHYDWVNVTQLFHVLPSHFPEYARDTQHLADILLMNDPLACPGGQAFSFPSPARPHHALDEARATRAKYQVIAAYAAEAFSHSQSGFDV